MDTTINTLRKSLSVNRFKNELNTLNSLNTTNEEVTNRVEQLKLVIDNLENKLTTPDKTTSTDKIFTELDKVIFKRPWARLSSVHRIIKINDYLKKTITNEELREQISTETKKYLEEGKLKTKKCIVYDPVEERVTSFPALKMDGKTFNINI